MQQAPYSRFAPRTARLLAAAFHLLAAGCVLDQTAKPLLGPPGGMVLADTPTTGTLPQEGPCPQVNLTARCSCEDLQVGAQTCAPNLVWSQCSCVQSDSALTENDAAVTFDWVATVTSSGSCQAGRYDGHFQGTYRSSLLGNAPIPVESVPSGSHPGLELNLNESLNGEFYEVAGASVRGTANGMYPFQAEVTGQLDCTTSSFSGQISGYYEVPIFGRFYFSGPVTAAYNRETHQLYSGTWSSTEPNAPGAGGSGTWEATWAEDD